jgi:4-diphosphocytidyl-2-C-methyl-D-erythritol kinase
MTRTRLGATTVRVHAPAKLNLTLRVLGVHADGYHELRTTFQSLALHDTLTFTPVAGPFTMTTNDPACPVDETNLVWKAADTLWRAGRRRGRLSGVHAHLEKRIPQQAGLGGGSSDAAATLRALSRLWGMELGDGERRRIARQLGADVSFFLIGGTALGVERGDLLFPLVDHQRAAVVIVMPAFGVSTRDAYAWWDERYRAEAAPAARAADPDAEWVNDLQGPVAARHPEISRLVTRLRRAGASYAAMSGSGAAVFGLFGSDGAARSAAQAVRASGRAVLVSRTLDRRAYRRVAEPR